MNISLLADFRRRAREQAEALFPATIRLLPATSDVAATTAGLKRGGKLEEGGQRIDDDLVFRVRKELITVDPDTLLGVKVFWVEENRTFRIDAVGTGGETTPFYKLACNAIPQ